jgi:hypothetical protein
MMPEMILLPNGQVLIINGGATGYAAGSSIGVTFGGSNAANPMCGVLSIKAGTNLILLQWHASTLHSVGAVRPPFQPGGPPDNRYPAYVSQLSTSIIQVSHCNDTNRFFAHHR